LREWLHRRIREDWGFPDPPEDDDAAAIHLALSRQEIQLWLSGVPDLEDQAGIWKILRPEEIGVQLTEGFMMDPEASVSALAFSTTRIARTSAWERAGRSLRVSGDLEREFRV